MILNALWSKYHDREIERKVIEEAPHLIFDAIDLAKTLDVFANNTQPTVSTNMPKVVLGESGGLKRGPHKESPQPAKNLKGEAGQSKVTTSTTKSASASKKAESKPKPKKAYVFGDTTISCLPFMSWAKVKKLSGTIPELSEQLESLEDTQVTPGTQIIIVTGVKQVTTKVACEVLLEKCGGKLGKPSHWLIGPQATDETISTITEACHANNITVLKIPPGATKEEMVNIMKGLRPHKPDLLMEVSK